MKLRCISAAVGIVDFPSRHRAFQDPALQGLYEGQQRERAAGLESPAHASPLERQRDLAP